jgi:hypothetical protein
MLASLIVVGLAMQVTAQSGPPQILQIFREPLKSGNEGAYRRIDEHTARLSAELGCPHPYLGIESLTGSKEVWWFNGYNSTAERKQVVEDYARNTRLLAALKETNQQKASLTGEAIEVFASYRPDLTIGAPWILGQGRFLVITVTKANQWINGTVFEATDGTRFVVMPARTRKKADVVAGPQVPQRTCSPFVHHGASQLKSGSQGTHGSGGLLLDLKGHRNISTSI